MHLDLIAGLPYEDINSFRKSFNAGPLRFTVSKSGVSTSFGGKGARVTKLANGRTRSTLSVPGTGISYVSETSGKKAAKSRVQPAKAPRARSQTSTVATDAPMTVAAVRSLGVILICSGILLTFMLPPIGIALAVFGAYRVIKARDICEKHNAAMREVSNEQNDEDGI